MLCSSRRSGSSQTCSHDTCDALCWSRLFFLLFIVFLFWEVNTYDQFCFLLVNGVVAVFGGKQPASALGDVPPIREVEDILLVNTDVTKFCCCHNNSEF